MAAFPSNTCPICNYDSTRIHAECEDNKQVVVVNCDNCGDHSILKTAIDELVQLDRIKKNVRSRVAFKVRRLRPDELITPDTVLGLERTSQLASAEECLDNLVLYLADAHAPGEDTYLNLSTLRAIIGVEQDSAAGWAARELESSNLLRVVDWSGDGIRASGVSLSAKGWERHREIMKAGSGSRHAFMAMRFGEAEMDAVFNDHFVPAVKDTGFELRRTDGPHATAGLIDNRMRVEIRTSRFLVCDLSHGNQGAYWEAGFAEGLGRPVFYTCSEQAFSDPNRKVHFDTNHQTIVRFDESDPSNGMKDLKAIIRATLPGEAILDDADA